MYELFENDRNFVLEYLSFGKGCFPSEYVTGFDSPEADLGLLQHLGCCSSPRSASALFPLPLLMDYRKFLF